MSQEPLADSFGRGFHYLRLSLEDACNFRCVYCLPDGHIKTEPEPPLSLDELRRLLSAFAGLGFWKVRLTGGEPTVRRDVVEIARLAAATPGVRQVALSTNGYRLAELAAPLKEAGLSAVNVSVDSLRPERFALLTGQDKLGQVLEGVSRSLELGLEVKVNAVLLRGVNEDEIGDFLTMTRSEPISARFIELMPTADNRELFAQRHLPAAALLERLRLEGWAERERRPGDGPARNFTKPGHAGTVGVIAPYAAEFCSTCNRLRVTSRGALRLCLFAEGDAPLRHLLQDDGQQGALQAAVREQLARKEVSHYLPEGKVGNARHFAMMGG